jgi:protoporphyrinogen oxidase
MSGIILVGLGVSGLACAMQLQQNHKTFTAFEKESVAGGLTRSESMDGFIFDYGPHILLNTPELIESLNLELRSCVCKSTIFLNTAQVLSVPAPLQHHLYRLPVTQRVQVLLDIIQRNSRLISAKTTHFQQHLISQAGKTLFRLFFQGYELKRLRYSLTEIDATMPNRIQSPTLAQLFGVSAASQQISGAGHEASFKYPQVGGIDALPSAMVNTLPSSQLHFQHNLLEIDLQRQQLRFNTNRQEFFEHLVLSLPLPEIIARLKNHPKAILEAAEQLIYSSLYILNLGLKIPAKPSWAIARIPKHEIDFYRISVPTHYSKANAPEGSSCLTIEVGHHEQRYPLNETEVRQRIYKGLNLLGILKSQHDVTTEWLHNIRYGHIIYGHKTRAALELIVAYLNQHRVYSCGKYGEWRDMLMPDAIQSGINVAQGIILANS